MWYVNLYCLDYNLYKTVLVGTPTKPKNWYSKCGTSCTAAAGPDMGIKGGLPGQIQSIKKNGGQIQSLALTSQPVLLHRCNPRYISTKI